MSGPFKMKGFSGFGNSSPAKDSNPHKTTENHPEHDVDKRGTVRKIWDKATQIGMGVKGALTAVDDFAGSAKHEYNKEKASDEKAGRS